ncbi:CdiA family toxin C-terminal domain-containing protein [Proteus mirabilis]
MEKELSAETNYFKKTAIYLKWLSVDIGQDTAFSGGLVAGIPSGLYETIDGLASLATNPLETYQAIKAVIQSDNAFDTLTQAVKQSYIERIEKLEAEYQKAGVSGSFNAGVESGKLIFDLVGLFAGGAGVAKGSSQLIAKTSAKIIEKTTRFSFPDGISFQIELPKHLATVDKFTQKMGISGGHNANVFYNVVKDKNLKIIKQTPTSVRGIMYIEYKIPAKHPQTGEITHYKGNGAQPFKKTIYDPKIFSDQKILELGQKQQLMDIRMR